MKKTNKKNIIKISIFSFLSISLVTLTPLLTSCANSYGITFGNFQAYISPTLWNRLNKKVVKTNSYFYDSNDPIPTLLQNKTINLSVSTDNMVAKLIKNNLVSKINWSDFGLSSNNKLVTNANEALALFSNTTKMISEAYKSIGINNLLEYAIPYFTQNYVFVYRGNLISELSSSNVTFNDIFRYITQFNTKTNTYEINNPYNRFVNKFKESKNPSVGMVSGPRTLFDVANIVKQEKEGSNNVNVNPTTGLLNQQSVLSISELNTIFGSLSSYFKPFPDLVSLNSNSNVILNKIALQDFEGAFMYNGDALYASQGGDYSVSTISPDNFHVVIPKNNLLAMDGIVFNNKNNSEQNLLSYKLAFNIALSGSDLHSQNDVNKNIFPNQTNKPNIADTVSSTDDSYLYGSMSNFDYVNYTPELNKLLNYINNQNYFSSNMKELQLKLLNIIPPTIPSHSVEFPLNDLSSSNLNISYLKFKNEM